MSELRTDDVVKCVDLSDWELFTLRAMVRDGIDASYVLMAEGRVCTNKPEAMARFSALAEKLK